MISVPMKKKKSRSTSADSKKIKSKKTQKNQKDDDSQDSGEEEKESKPVTKLNKKPPPVIKKTSKGKKKKLNGENSEANNEEEIKTNNELSNEEEENKEPEADKENENEEENHEDLTRTKTNKKKLKKKTKRGKKKTQSTQKKQTPPRRTQSTRPKSTPKVLEEESTSDNDGFSSDEDDHAISQKSPNNKQNDDQKIKTTESNQQEYDSDDLYDLDFDLDDQPTYSFKKFIIPELNQIKYNNKNVNKNTEKVFHAFFGTHIDEMFTIGFFSSIIFNQKIFENDDQANKTENDDQTNKTENDDQPSKTENDDQANKRENEDQPNTFFLPISKYETKKDPEHPKNTIVSSVEINIFDFIEFLTDQYQLKNYDSKYIGQKFDFSSENLKDDIINFAGLMNILNGDYLYSEIYKDCSIDEAIKNDLKNSDFLHKYVIVEVNDNDDEVDFEVNVNIPLTPKSPLKIDIKYDLVWLIEENRTFVHSYSGKLFDFNGENCSEVQIEDFKDLCKNSKPLYACYTTNTKY